MYAHLCAFKHVTICESLIIIGFLTETARFEWFWGTSTWTTPGPLADLENRWKSVACTIHFYLCPASQVNIYQRVATNLLFPTISMGVQLAIGSTKGIQRVATNLLKVTTDVYCFSKSSNCWAWEDQPPASAISWDPKTSEGFSHPQLMMQRFVHRSNWEWADEQRDQADEWSLNYTGEFHLTWNH